MKEARREGTGAHSLKLQAMILPEALERGMEETYHLKPSLKLAIFVAAVLLLMGPACSLPTTAVATDNVSSVPAQTDVIFYDLSDYKGTSFGVNAGETADLTNTPLGKDASSMRNPKNLPVDVWSSDGTPSHFDGDVPMLPFPLNNRVAGAKVGPGPEPK